MPTSASHRQVDLVAVGAAAGGVLLVAAMVVIAGQLTPGYSHFSQYISELGARGAPYEWHVRFLGFLPAGVLLLCFCVAALFALPSSGSTRTGLLGLSIFCAGYIAAAAFPCDPGCRPQTPSLSQVVHNATGLLGYVLAPAFLFSLGLAARSWPKARWLAQLSFALAFFALAGLLTLSSTSSAVGLSQRVLEASVLGWVVACSLFIWRRRAA
jgi:Protein of unknown function (DUF998)